MRQLLADEIGFEVDMIRFGSVLTRSWTSDVLLYCFLSVNDYVVFQAALSV